MFTGIITHLGILQHITHHGGGERSLRIQADTVKHPYNLGQSIACSGICLTITECHLDGFSVTLSHETLEKTTARSWQTMDSLNLEHPLSVGELLGGHWVLGHVDGMACVHQSIPQGESLTVILKTDRQWAPYLCPKGSITLDGVSLTINSVDVLPDDVIFSVHLIPHTLGATATKWHHSGTWVNLEIDTIARHLVHLLQWHPLKP